MMTARAILLPALLLVVVLICSAEPVGTINEVGTTWCDRQQLGSSGRMISVDESGNVHTLWTNGLTQSPTSRHIFYNIWDPAITDFIWDGGVQVDMGVQACYGAGTVTPDGRYYPVLNGPETAVAGIDFMPHAGSFTNVAIDLPANTDNLYYPKVAFGQDEKLHVLASSDELFSPQLYRAGLHYCRGVPQIDDFGIGTDIEWEDVIPSSCSVLLDSIRVPAYEIVTSRVSDRVAAVWVHSRANDSTFIPYRDNDLYYRFSDDGGNTWSETFNVTNFDPSGTGGVNGPLDENIDTFRVFADVSALFDNEDILHIAFTTSIMRWNADTVVAYASQLWHWDELARLYTPIRALDAAYLSGNWAADIGEWEVALQRPSLSFDPVSGSLFCSYQLADTAQWTNQGIPQADAWVSRSDDNGLHWSVGTNVTSTDGGQNTPSGQSLHERDITLSETVSWENGAGYLNMQYILDHDAGCASTSNPTGPPTLNEVHFQRIPINDIPAQPTVDMCWPQMRVDGTGYPCAEMVRNIAEDRIWDYELGPNFPNPFNPSTTIQFNLSEPALVSLTVHDVLGRQVAALINHGRMNAGTQFVTFDGAGLPSGVYFCRLQAGEQMLTHKMMLLK
ncbi:T9SS type A sorting domain-containing protein [bacterium]|nr:T9SS type A sorting domain-containing protein [bacterium]